MVIKYVVLVIHLPLVGVSMVLTMSALIQECYDMFGGPCGSLKVELQQPLKGTGGGAIDAGSQELGQRTE